MMRAAVTLPRPLAAPLLTGWSPVRYGRFAGGAEEAALRARLHSERPDLAALDLNQMYTQLPDGTLIIGDSHATASAPEPFQPEAAFSAFLDEAEALFDMPTPRPPGSPIGCRGTTPSPTVGFLAGRGRAYPFADAVGEVRGLGEIDQALAAASIPGAPLRIGLVPGR